jgi:hypothetical protein
MMLHHRPGSWWLGMPPLPVLPPRIQQPEITLLGVPACLACRRVWRDGTPPTRCPLCGARIALPTVPQP